MLKFFIIQLCKSSASICNYNKSSETRLIDLDVLEDGLLWAVKRNLSVQLIYPTYQLPPDYEKLIENFEHIKILPFKVNGNKGSDIVVFDGWSSFEISKDKHNVPAIIHTNISDFIDHHVEIANRLHLFVRLNIIFNDIPSFADELYNSYEVALTALSDRIEKLYLQGVKVQFNLLTDRLVLDEMNNCNAGDECLTLAPDGNLYVCPAFYLSGNKSIGSLTSGINIGNQQLYNIKYAPICRECDAYHCRRCVWLNKQTTLEVNTPSQQQCVMAHIERRVSKRLLEKLRTYGVFSPNVEIPEINYLDPIDKLIKTK